MRRTVILSLLLVLTASSLIAHAPSASAALRARRVFACRATQPDCWPTAFDFTPDGRRLFYVERFTGQVRVRNLRTRADTQWATIPNVQTTGTEQGLLGLALDPAWKLGERWVYVYYTRDASPDENVIARLRKQTGQPTTTEELETIPDAVSNHNGGVIDFGPDRRLYAVTGDGGDEARAQDEQDPAGKVLRINKDGSIPLSNPFPGSPAFSIGHRNSFGFTFDPRTGRLWQTENGPSCNDEVNLVVAGGNYAWGPNQDCGSLEPPLDTNQDGPEPRLLPEQLYLHTIAVTGATFCARCGLGKARNGDLLVGSWGGGGTIRALNLTKGRNGITGQQVVFDPVGGVLAMETGPGRRVYFSDSTGVFRLVRP
jgi:glucose/arabinose dehydrogenase